MIYFAKIRRLGLIKIGCTHQPIRQRLVQLESQFGSRVELLGVKEGSYDAEDKLHRAFSHLRVGHSNSELFRPDHGLLRFIFKHSWNTDRLRVVPRTPLCAR